MAKGRTGAGARQRKGSDVAAIEARRALVSRRVLGHKSTRAIAEELANLPEGQRPLDVSPRTVARDVVALRAEWAAARIESYDAYVAEGLARLAELEEVWRPLALEAKVSLNAREIATAQLLAIHRERMRLVQPAPADRRGAGVGGIQLPAPGTLPPGSAMRVIVEYADDWREAIASSQGHALPVEAIDVAEVDDGEGEPQAGG